MFGMENEEASLYGQYAVELRHQSIRTQASLSILNFGQSFIQRIGLLCTMLLAARGIVYGGLTAGDFVLINTYVGQIFQPLFVSYRCSRIIYAFGHVRSLLNDVISYCASFGLAFVCRD